MNARGVCALIGVGLATIAAAAVLVLGDKATRLAGTNSVRIAEYVVSLPPQGVICQTSETVPSAAAAVQVFTGTYGEAGRLRFEINAGGRRVRTGLAGGFRDGQLAIPIKRTSARVVGARICLRNTASGRLALAGTRVPPESAARIDGRVAPGRLRIEYLRPGRESWWQLAGTVARRLGAPTAPLGGLTLWVAAGLLLAGWGIALRALVRTARS